MKHSAADIVRESGPFPDVDQVNGVSYDGNNVWIATGDRLSAIDPASGNMVRSLDVPAPDIEQRVALAIIGRSPVARQLDFARERGWSHLNFYQIVGDEMIEDYRLVVGGDEWASVLVWRRDGDAVRLFWAAEGGAETADPGFDPHLAPDPTPLWNVLDWTPEGRGKDWYPKLDY